MDTQSTDSIEGIVLREIKYKESAKIVEILTPYNGKITFTANSIFTSKKEFLSSTIRFSKSQYNFRKSRQYYYLKDALLLNSYSQTIKKFEITVYKSMICDFILRTDDYDTKMVYNLVDKIFETFDTEAVNPKIVLLSFMLKYITFAGYKPNFDHCSICAEKINDSKIFSFSSIEGGAICDNCKNLVKTQPIKREDFLNLKRILYTPSDKLKEESFNYYRLFIIIKEFLLTNMEMSNFNSLTWTQRLFMKEK